MKCTTRNSKGVHIILEVTNKTFLSINFIRNNVINIGPNTSILAITKTFCQFFEIIDLNHAPHRLIFFSFNTGLFESRNVLKVQSHDCMFGQFIFAIDIWSCITRINEFVNNLEILIFILFRHISRFSPDFINTEARHKSRHFLKFIPVYLNPVCKDTIIPYEGTLFINKSNPHWQVL